MVMEFDLLGVGDADAIVLRCVEGGGVERVVVIDGGNPTDGDAVVRHVRERTLGGMLGRPAVDWLISTHPDQDHIGGLSTVIAELPVRAALVHDPRLAVSDLGGALARIRRRGRTGDEERATALEAGVELITKLRTHNPPIPCYEPFSGELIPGFPTYLHICGPSRRFYQTTLRELVAATPSIPDLARLLGASGPFPGSLLGSAPASLSTAPSSAGAALRNLLAAGASSGLLGGGYPRQPTVPLLDQQHDESLVNQTSVILSVVVSGSVRCLFTADANDKALGDASSCDALGFANVGILQVPHHGSHGNLSTDFVQRIRPGLAMVSAKGKDGHPSPDVIGALDRVGAKVFSTAPGGLWHHPPGWSRPDFSPAVPLNP